jgi:hypothetical protein
LKCLIFDFSQKCSSYNSVWIRIRIRIRIRTFFSDSDSDPAKTFGLFRIRIRIHNTALCRCQIYSAWERCRFVRFKKNSTDNILKKSYLVNWPLEEKPQRIGSCSTKGNFFFKYRFLGLKSRRILRRFKKYKSTLVVKCTKKVILKIISDDLPISSQNVGYLAISFYR